MAGDLSSHVNCTNNCNLALDLVKKSSSIHSRVILHMENKSSNFSTFYIPIVMSPSLYIGTYVCRGYVYWSL